MVTSISAHALQHKFYKSIVSLVERYPRLYLGFVTLLALLGYAYVLLFPLLILASISYIYEAIAGAEVIDWQSALIWLAVLILAGVVSYRCIMLRLALPTGLTLVEDKAPELFKIVRELHTRFKRPEISRIVITGNYELDIIKTPRWALPVWSTNTIVIGLPVLQSLSPKQFDCMVARRIGQFSKRDNLLTNWLYQLRPIWQQYRAAYTKQKAPGIELLKWFFTVYAPFYSAFSAFVARRDELNADTYAMQLYNDEEVLEMLTADAVCRRYIENRYWPAIHKIAALETKSLPAPHSKMATAVAANLKGEKLATLISELLKLDSRWKDPVPSLSSRIKNIGHNKPYMEELTGETAAARYLGTSINGVIDLVDKLWQKTFIEKRKRQRRHKKKHVVTDQATSA